MKRVWLMAILLSSFVCIGSAQADLILPSDQARLKKKREAMKPLTDHWPKAFQAKYIRHNRHGEEQFQEYSNGQGLLRVDLGDGAGNWIYNYPKAQETFVDNRSKIARTYGGSDLTVFDAESAKRRGGAFIGERNIDGHPCKGFRFSGGGASTWYVSESWFGDDTGCLVLTTTKTRMDDSSVKLLEYKAIVPAASLFVIPSGYKSE